MARKSKKQKAETSVNTTVNTTCSSVNMSMMSECNTTLDFRAQITEKYEKAKAELEERRAKGLRDMRMHFESLMVALTEEQQNTKTSLETEEDLRKILSGEIFEAKEEEEIDFARAVTTVKKAPARSRRSRSLDGRLSVISENPRRRSSSSSGLCDTTFDSNKFKTPAARPMTHRLLTDKKYTVKRAIAIPDSGIHLKRFQRAGEEAISTAGSPLLIQSGALLQPEVNIPLRNGQILNIEAKKMGNSAVPPVDPITKSKLKVLVENLCKVIKDG